MVALTGRVSLLPLAGIANSLLTRAFHAFAPVTVPYESFAHSVPGAAPVVSDWPVSTAPTALAGTRQQCFVDDYYHRIHMFPSVIEVGNVVTDQVHTVLMWNAFLRPVQLLDISTSGGEGIGISGQQQAPFMMPALAERTWSITVSPDGPPAIDAEITWQFFGLLPRHLLITGQRISGWVWRPDWANGVLERLEWLTDIQRSRTNTELRRALRVVPRRSQSFQIVEGGRSRALLDLSLHNWGARTWALPIWQDVQRVGALIPGALNIDCATDHREFTLGGLALLLGETAFDYEVLEVEDVTETGLRLRSPVQRAWPRGALIYPAKPARLTAQPRFQRRSNDVVRSDLEFMLEPERRDEIYAAEEQYRGWPVLVERPAENDDWTSSYLRLLDVLDNSTGQPHVTDAGVRAFSIQAHRWMLAGAEQRSVFRNLCHLLSGRQGAIWIPSWMSDLALVSDVAQSAVTLEIANVNYGRLAAGVPGRRHIRIVFRDGRVLCRRVTGSTEISADVERLGLDAPVPYGWLRREVLQISYMALMRLDSDLVELQHETDIQGLATSQLVFREVPDDEL